MPRDGRTFPVVLAELASRTLRAGRAVPAALVALAALAVQAPAIRRVLIWDDVFMFEWDDLYVRADRWVEAVTHTLGKETTYWRPLATTSYMLESLVHGGVGDGFRTTSALLHAAAAALAFLLLDALTARRGLVLVAALVFALHPVHVETTTWIASRFDLLAALCVLGAMAAAGDGRVSRVRLGVVGLLCFAAPLAKESGIVAPALVILVAAARSPDVAGTAWAAIRQRRGVAIAAVAGAAAAVVLRTAVVGVSMPSGTGSDDAGGVVGRVLLVGRAAVAALGSLALPWSGPALVHAGPRPVPPDDVAAWVGLALVALVAVAVVVGLRRTPRAGLLGAACIVAYLPVSQVVPLVLAGGAETADRALYLPAFLAVAAIVALRDRGHRGGAVAAPRWAVWGAGLVVVVCLGAMRVESALQWNDPVTLWTRAAERAPASSTVHANLARVLWARGELPAAQAAADRARDAEPSLGAEIRIARGNVDDAVTWLDAAIERRPDSHSRWLRAEIREGRGAFQAALDDYEMIAAAETGRSRHQPHRPAALAGAARCLFRIGDRSAATQKLKAAITEASPRDVRAWRSITQTQFAFGDVEAALRSARTALAAGMEEARVVELELDGLRRTNRPADVLERLRRLAALRPDAPLVHDELGYALWESGDPKGAEDAFRNALRASPEFAQARFHLAALLERTGRAEESRTELDRARRDGRDDPALIRLIDAWTSKDRPRDGR